MNAPGARDLSITPAEGRSPAGGASSLRVGLVGPLPPPSGGMANQTRQLAGLLEGEGIEVVLIQTNPPYRPAWVERLKGLRAVVRLAGFLSRLWRAAGRVDLFHVMANSGWSWHLFAMPAILVARLRRVPVIVNYRGGEADTFFRRSIRWVRPVLGLVQRVIVPSGFLEAVFAKYGIQADVVPNIIDLERFGGLVRDDAGSGPHLVVPRNLEPVYDIPTALRAFGLLVPDYPEARLSVAGSGPSRRELEGLADALGVKDRVSFTGRLSPDGVAALYGSADFVLNPSTVDNMPNSVLEALASGVPVVTTNVGGIPYMVEHERTAMLVPPGDPASMAEAVRRLLGDDRLRRGLVEAGREEVLRYTWVRIRERLLGLYREVGVRRVVRP